MGEPFIGDIFLPTRESAATKDKNPPKLGKLSAGGMIDVAGLGSTSGVETAVITGDRFQRLTGKETIYRVGDVIDDTKGDWADKVKGSVDAEITKDYTWLVKGDVVETIKGETKQTYTGAVATVFKSEKMAEEPMEWFHHVNEVFSYGAFHSDNFGAYTLVGGIGLTAFLSNTDLRGIDLGFKAIIGEKHAIELWEKEEKVDITLMMQRIRVTETFVMAVEPGVGAAMMHEVAVTQEIFAVGANQAF